MNEVERAACNAGLRAAVAKQAADVAKLAAKLAAEGADLCIQSETRAAALAAETIFADLRIAELNAWELAERHPS